MSLSLSLSPPRFPRQDSAGSLPPHHHTVHSGSDRTACHHCNQSRAKRARGRARAPRGKTRPRETTVFSVGRFRVTHVGKKSGNLEKTGQSEQAEGDTLQKDDKVGQSETELHEKCSLREMFKDTPTDDTNGAFQRGTEPMGAEVSMETGGGNDGKSHVEGLKNGTVQAESTDKGTSQTDSIHNGTAQKEDPNNGTAPTKDTNNGTAQTEHIGGDGAAQSKSLHHGTVVIGGPAGREFRYSRVQTEDEEVAQTEDSKDDMVQMEDIKDCKVSQEEGGEEPQRGQCVESNNRKRGAAHAPHKW
ncbi:RELL2 protein, partial [Polyodon spathula]|nr:RELL2 protein [Polyodon spathula]